MKFLGAILVHPVRRQNFAGTGAPYILQHLRLCHILYYIINYINHNCSSNASLNRWITFIWNFFIRFVSIPPCCPRSGSCRMSWERCGHHRSPGDSGVPQTRSSIKLCPPMSNFLFPHRTIIDIISGGVSLGSALPKSWRPSAFSSVSWLSVY